jgi:sensor domain CHASE-containing protein/putative methionine-R-sulfoxide reductase with GAF domain
MSLRKKTLLIVGLASIATIILLYWIIYRILIQSYIEIEQQDTMKSVNQVLNKLSDEINMLDSTAHNLSLWDESHQFTERKYQVHSVVNSFDFSLTDLNINFIILTDKKGNIVHYKGIDLVTIQDIELPNELYENVHLESPLVKHSDPVSSITGFLQTEKSALIFASRPIIQNEYKPTVAGALIVAIYFESKEIKNISESTLQTVKIKDFRDRHKYPDCKRAADIITQSKQIYVKDLDENLIAGYSVINDIFGNPVLIVRVDKPRNIYLQGKKTINYFLISLIIIGVLFSILIYFLLERYVISKLLKLKNDVNNIAASRDFSSRVVLKDNDELSNLGTNINQMLESLESSQRLIQHSKTESEQRVKERTSELEKVNKLLEVQLSIGNDREQIFKNNITILTKRNQYEKVIRSVAESVNKTKELQEIIDNAIKSIHANIKYATTISLYLVEGNYALLRGGIGHPRWFINKVNKIPHPKGFTWKTIIENRPLLCNDTDFDTSMGKAGRELGIKSYLSVPLRCGNNAIGCLKIDSFDKHSFTTEDQNLLEIVARQIDVAIDNSKAETVLKNNLEQISKKNKYETIIRTVTQSVHQSIDLGEVMEHAVESMHNNIDQIEHVGIYLREDDFAVMKAYRGYPDWFIKRVSKIPYRIGFTWKTIIDGKPRYCPDIDKDNVIGPAEERKWALRAI